MNSRTTNRATVTSSAPRSPSLRLPSTPLSSSNSLSTAARHSSSFELK
ncbi:MAG TPA: hypothetical protein VMF65_05945 [Acidimicrobiales bacterium]|nr:hypothetical protein [Acidimicrobiales bacterium]